MPRQRFVKPEFFKHSDLYDAEASTGLPLRVAFAGLWTVADREGRFVWRPRELKTDVLPYDAVDFAGVLDALEHFGFVRSYVVDGKRFGVIPSFAKHQTFHLREQPSKLPVPPEHGASPVQAPAEAVPCTPVAVAVAVTAPTAVAGTVVGDGVGASTTTDVDDVETEPWRDRLGDDGYAAFVGYRRSHRIPIAFESAIRALGPGGVREAGPWPDIGAALAQLAGNGERWNESRLRGYIRRQRDAPTPISNPDDPGGWMAALQVLERQQGGAA
jgi:hypothetical protein